MNDAQSVFANTYDIFHIFQSTSASNSFPSTGAHTPGSPRKASSLSPPIERRMKKDYAGSPRKIRGSPTKSIDPKLGAPRRTAGKADLFIDSVFGYYLENRYIDGRHYITMSF